MKEARPFSGNGYNGIPGFCLDSSIYIEYMSLLIFCQGETRQLVWISVHYISITIY